jgi:2-oxoglutarate ferredoxin oxidoreductase subunit alpha
MAKANDPDYKPYRRDPETLVRQWAIPGTEGLRHRIGGLEKENITGNVSTDPMNHQIMTEMRAEKVNRVVKNLPLQDIYGDQEGDLLVVGWGSTKGAIQYAVDELRAAGKKISHAHFHYIMPLPANTEEVFSKFKKIIVCELNSGQLVYYLRMMHPQFPYLKYNKVQGLPFVVNELTAKFNQLLEEK